MVNSKYSIGAPLVLLLLFFGLQAKAEKIYMQPGSEIKIFDAPMQVVCLASSAFKRYCRCSETGVKEPWAMELVLRPDGTTDLLGTYLTQGICEDKLEHNPACK